MIKGNKIDDVNERLLKIVNEFKQCINSHDFNEYILSLIFYKFLTEKQHVFLEKSGITPSSVKNYAVENLGYYINPNLTLDSVVNNGDLKSAFCEVEKSSGDGDVFSDIFSSLNLDDVQLNNDKLKEFAKDLSEIELIGNNPCALANTFEYLISLFVNDLGKMGLEVYTPSDVSELMAKIVSYDKSNIRSLYDPTCGTCSSMSKVLDETKVNGIYGQDLNSTSYSIGKMNLLIHGVSFKNIHLKNENTLESHGFEGKSFDAIVSNPPFRYKWDNVREFSEDPRFKNLGGLPLKSHADYAFVQHMIYHLDNNGTMVVVLPHGILFRGGPDGRIRRHLVQKCNYLDAVIGLPGNIFHGTSIPTCVLVFKKDRTNKDVLFIDASKDFKRIKRYQMEVGKENIKKIIDTYSKRAEIDKYSHKASLDEIADNDFNLNIPRYVDTFEPEPARSVEEIKNDIDGEMDKLNEIADKIFDILKKI